MIIFWSAIMRGLLNTTHVDLVVHGYSNGKLFNSCHYTITVDSNERKVISEQFQCKALYNVFITPKRGLSVANPKFVVYYQ